MNGKINLDIM